MNKIIIVGPSGSGKSTFARNLKSILDLPLYSLDNIFWKKDKTHIDKKEFDEKVSELVKLDCWIIEGDYARTYKVRMDKADTIFFLNYPLDVCLKGVEERIGKVREDIPWVEDKFDPSFKQWIIEWYNNKLPILTNLLDEYKQTKNVIIFNNRDEAHLYLNNLKNSK